MSNLRGLPNSTNFTLPQPAYLLNIEVFPSVELDQSNTQQNLGCQPDAPVRDLDTLLSLGEHDPDEEELEWEAKEHDLR